MYLSGRDEGGGVDGADHDDDVNDGYVIIMYLSGRDEGGGVDGRVSVCRHADWPARHCY